MFIGILQPVEFVGFAGNHLLILTFGLRQMMRSFFARNAPHEAFYNSKFTQIRLQEVLHPFGIDVFKLWQFASGFWAGY